MLYDNRAKSMTLGETRGIDADLCAVTVPLRSRRGGPTGAGGRRTALWSNGKWPRPWRVTTRPVRPARPPAPGAAPTVTRRHPHGPARPAPPPGGDPVFRARARPTARTDQEPDGAHGPRARRPKSEPDGPNPSPTPPKIFPPRSGGGGAPGRERRGGGGRGGRGGKRREGGGGRREMVPGGDPDFAHGPGRRRARISSPTPTPGEVVGQPDADARTGWAAQPPGGDPARRTRSRLQPY